MRAGRVFRIFVACSIQILLVTLATAAVAQQRVVAIGDVHGAYTEFSAILQRTGLIDANQKWSGGSATLIQLGDVIDRGAQARDCLDLVMTLKQQAGKSRGKVIPLLGNHETMNMMHDLRYVTPEIYRKFATERSENVREKAYQDYLKFFAAHAEHAHAAAPAADEPARQKWMDAHPLGFFEYCDAFGPDGKYGRWLRQNRAIVQVAEGIFVHGGLNPALGFRDIAELDTQVHNDLAAFDFLWKALADQKIIWRYMTFREAMQHVGEELKWTQVPGRVAEADLVDLLQKFMSLQSCLTVSSEGPLWYRGLAETPEEKLAGSLDAMLARLKARFIVDGHTVLSTAEITQRFDNRVFLIDTGMNKESYKGRASALEIRGGQFTVYHVDGEPRVLAPPGGKTTPLKRADAGTLGRQDKHRDPGKSHPLLPLRLCVFEPSR